jgi:Carbohydrate binding module (family 6).
MKYMVQAGKEPWATSFAKMKASSYAKYTYTVQWKTDSVRVVEGLGANYEKFKYDALAAYYNSLMWYITGDVRHAQKCVQIFNAMVNIRSIVTGTQSLGAGRVIWKLLEGAEIIKSTYTGWQQSDIDAFEAMLVYPGYSTTESHSADAEHSFYWAMYNGDYGRHGNQGLFGLRGIMAMGIFMDNELMYDRALRYLKGQAHRSDDLPYVSGPPIVGTSPSATNSYFDTYTMSSPYIQSTIADYGYNEVMQNYIWENGQSQESSRDQSHALLGVSIINTMCEMAWNQGEDLYGLLNYRPLLGMEFYNRYNVSYDFSFADQSAPWEPTAASGEFIQRRDRSGRWYSKAINPCFESDFVNISRGTFVTTGNAPVWEMVLGHYKSRLNLPKTQYKWTARCDSISQKSYGYEQQGFQVDHPGFGGLTFHRADNCPGDPCTFVGKQPVYGLHILPARVEAEDFDFFTAQGQGRTYYELSGTKVANDYRPDSAVTVKSCSAGGYEVSDMVAGEWLAYTVYVPTSQKYAVKVNYSAPLAGSKIRIAFGGVDKTADVALSATGAGVWADYTLAGQASLTAGVQDMRVYPTGVSNNLELNSISVQTATTGVNEVTQNTSYTAYGENNRLLVNGVQPNDVLTVWALNGTLIYTVPVVADNVSLPLPNGFYLVKIQSAGACRVMKVVVK